MPQMLRSDDITWTRTVEPRERYRILYLDRDGARSERIIELQKIGEVKGVPYLGVVDKGKFKTMRADRVLAVLEQLSSGHVPTLRSWKQVGYADTLPAFPVASAVHKIATVAKSNRTWTVDLNHYTCTCPEKRIRSGFGYAPGQLGFVCPHIARAILEHLPAETHWPDELLAFLRDPRRVHIDNLS
ncbi:MAG TPA: hypothetical protein VLI45_09300 [Acidobacteriaceae bacterium]|nr:hypothetical protein [Acidobacteriaceae bacterium]